MENKNIVMVRHHFLKVGFDNKVYNNQRAALNDAIVIDVTQRDKKYGIAFSPMKLGPLKSFDGMECDTFEEYYQTSKVYPGMVDENGNLTQMYFEWRNKWYKCNLENTSPKLLRHPQAELGFEHRQCLYSIWYNEETKEIEKLDYVTSRKKIYIKEYAKLVVNTSKFKELQALVNEGKKIALVDFDAYNYYDESYKKHMFTQYAKKCKDNHIAINRKMEDFINIKTMKDVINCNFLPAGHGFVIKMLLQGDLEVVDGNLIDHIGIL